MKLLIKQVIESFDPVIESASHRARRRPCQRIERLWRLSRHGSIGWGTLLVLTAATFGGVAAWNTPFSVPSPVEPRFETSIVWRGPLPVSLTESGQLESANNTTLRHQVEFGGGLVILKLAEEGTWVAKDQVLVELDSSRFIKNAQQQQLWTFVHDAGLKTAETRLVIQKMTNESRIAAAEQQLRIARLDLAKYLEADYVQQRTKILNEIQLATETLSTAQQGVDFDKRMLRKGFVTTDELKADQLSMTKAELALEIAREKLHVLEEYTHKRDLAQREANAIRLERELERIKLRAEFGLNQRQVDVLFYRRWSTHYRTQYNNALRQIKACVIRAPHEGVVVYANNGASSNANESPIYEGAKVWEGQAIVHLPDVTSMQVKARIHESKILLVREGLPVTIRVDARNGETFRGVVEKVAVGPLSPSWTKFNLKEYATVIRVVDEPERVAMLKPGMTAEVTIHVDPLEAALQIPIQACVDRGGKHFAWVLDDKNEIHRRELKVRTASADAIEILDGLEEGEHVARNPRSDLAVEVAELGREFLVGEEAATSTPDSSMSSDEGWPFIFDDSPPTESPGDSPAASVTTAPLPPTGRLPDEGTKAAR